MSNKKRQSLSVAPLSGPNARCMLCDALLDDCACALDMAAPSIFATPMMRLGAESGRLLAELASDELEEE